MDTVKLRVESTKENEKPIEVECKCCICIAFDPLNSNANMIQTMTGRGDTKYMLLKAVESLWGLSGKVFNDEVDRTIVGALMLDRLKHAILGDSTVSEIED